jgi:hypothetical protein
MAKVTLDAVRQVLPRRSTEDLVAASALALFTIAAILRLDYESVWSEELFTIGFSAPHEPFLRALSEHIATDRYAPGFYILAHLWMAAFGDSGIALRALNLVGVALLGGTMAYSRRIAWLGRAWLPFWVLLLTSRFTWYFVAEGRTYLFLLAGATLLSFLFMDILQRQLERKPAGTPLLLVMGVTVFILGALHYFGLLVAGSAILILFGMALHKRLRRDATAYFAIGCVTLVTQAAWAIFSAPRIAPFLNAPFWLEFQPFTAIRDFLIFTFSNNPLLPALAALAGLSCWRAMRDDALARGLVGIINITFVVALVVSLDFPVLSFHYLSVLAPPLLLIIAQFFVRAPQRWMLPAVYASVLLVSIPLVIIKSLDVHQEWREAADYIAARRQCDRAVMLGAPDFHDFLALRYHEPPGKSWRFLPAEQGSVDAALASPCPIVAWAGAMDRDVFDSTFLTLDWKGTPVKVVPLTQVYLLVRE